MTTTPYTTIQGDTWDIISLNKYNTEDKMDQLIAANQAYQFIRVFPAGIVLNIPVLDPVTLFTDLPPWLTGGTTTASASGL